jgi:hypothetical protein
MFRRKRAIRSLIIAGSVVLVQSFGGAASSAPPDRSANYYLPGCRAITTNSQSVNQLFAQGECIGIIEAVASMGPLCVPAGITFRQMTAVVVRWLDQHPERWNEDFMWLALDAMYAAWPWPCK